MSNLAAYFAENRYKHKYNLGDRVRGIWNGVPFAGSVAIDTLVDEYEGPYVMVFTDLPVKHEGGTSTLIKVKHSDILE